MKVKSMLRKRRNRLKENTFLSNLMDIRTVKYWTCSKCNTDRGEEGIMEYYLHFLKKLYWFSIKIPQIMMNT